MDSEKLLEKTLREKVKDLGGLALKFHCLSFTGFPDRIILMPFGKIYFVELKSEGKKPTKIQLAVHKILEDLGFQVLVIDSTEKLLAFLHIVKALRTYADRK